jgi:prevent-host-death family protein
MKTVEMKQAMAPLARYARDVAKEPVIVTKHGRPVAALMPIENADRETVALSTNPQFLALIERSRRRHQAEGGISTDEMRRRLRVDRRGARRKAAGGRSR